MNPGNIPEEIGSTTRSFFEIMKQQPALMGMIVANLGLLVFIFYALHAAGEFRDRLIGQVFQNTQQISDLKQHAIACPDPIAPR